MRDRIKEGPLFTVMEGRVRKDGGSNSRVPGLGGVVVLDPFESGVETYSAKYVVGKRRLPGLEAGRYGELSFFSFLLFQFFLLFCKVCGWTLLIRNGWDSIKVLP